MTHNSYEQERREQECIRRGDVEGLKRAIAELEVERVGRVARDDLRNWKDLAIVGISPETAYRMSDTFIQCFEDENDIDRLTVPAQKMELEFCLAVCAQTHGSDNPLVQRCRDIITRRIHTKLTVLELARALNVNPDYLSQLFSREEGLSLSDFIAREKVLAAPANCDVCREVFRRHRGFSGILFPESPGKGIQKMDRDDAAAVSGALRRKE